MAARLNRVMPEVRQQFVFLTGLVSQRATAQEARQQLDTTDFTPAAGLPTPQLSVRLSDASQASVEPSTPRRRPLRLRR
jgi:hypothetical protein